MSKRSDVKVTTVVGYVGLARHEIERAIAAAVRCRQLSDADVAALRKHWQMLDFTHERIARKRTRTRTRES